MNPSSKLFNAFPLITLNRFNFLHFNLRKLFKIFFKKFKKKHQKMPSIYNFTNPTHTVEFYASLSVCIFGTLTNFANLQVSLGKGMRNTTMGFYNILISIFNLLIIYFNLSLFFPQSIGQTQIINRSELTCIFVPYFFRVFLEMSQWLNVMVSFDRMYLVLDSTRSERPLNTKRNLLIALGLFLILCGINFFGFFYHLETKTSFSPNTNENVTVILCTSIYGLERDLIHIIARAVVPLILQTCTNIILVYRFYRIKNMVTSAFSISLKREFRFAKTIIILNGIFIISDMLALGIHLAINVYGYNQTYISTMSNQSAIASFVFVCAFQFVIFMVCDVLFIVNLLSNKKFRMEANKLYMKENVLVKGLNRSTITNT